MAVRIVRLGTTRAEGEGVRLGTVRRPPRGVRREHLARDDWYDAWLPELAPSAALLAWVHDKPIDDKRWAAFGRKYRREMAAPDRDRLLGVLAQLSQGTDFAVGCYCERADRCHRAILGDLLAAHGARVIPEAA